MKSGRFTATATVFLAVMIILAVGQPSVAQSPAATPAAGTLVRVETRFVDQASGREAGWGATGQILIPPQPDDPALQRWRQARTVAISLSRQSVTLAQGGRGLIRVGREIPFAGWFLRHGVSCGWLEAGTEWREIESALEVEAELVGADGAVRLLLTPEFSYLSGRSRRTVSFPGERAEIVLAPGVEARFAPSAAFEAFYALLLAGYDPLRRVWPVDLVLSVDLVDPVEATER